MVKSKSKIPIDVKQYPNLKTENPSLHYEFEEEIGSGKFAIVKKCKHKKTGQIYAAKIIRYDSDTLKFAIREYEMMMKENHSLVGRKGTVKLHEAYLVRKYLILVMELVDGKTLLDKFVGMHSLTEDDVAQVIKQLLEFLADWHVNNLVHLDLRPTNIRFITGREVRILDYNSCRHIPNKKAGAVVDVIGDTEFCAPEMLNFEPCMPGSDTWTIGVLTYVLLSGISPFFDEDEDKVILSVQKVKWEFDGIAFGSITSEAKDFIKKLFVRIPESRLTAEKALEHPWLSKNYESARKNSTLKIQDALRETDERLFSEEEEEYIYASCVLRTFDEEEYDSPDDSDNEEEEE